MTRNLRIWIAGIIVLAIAFLYVQRSKSRYTAHSESVFSGDKEAVGKVLIRKGEDELVLEKANDAWHIVGHDSLATRQNRIDDLMDRVLGVRRTTMMTERPEKWSIYSVDDSTGIHLVVYGSDGGGLGAFVFGRSTSDWSKNYVRMKPDPGVYLTDSSVMYVLSTSPTYWGTKPKPPEPAPDSLGTDTTSAEPRIELAPPPTPVSTDSAASDSSSY